MDFEGLLPGSISHPCSKCKTVDLRSLLPKSFYDLRLGEPYVRNPDRTFSQHGTAAEKIARKTNPIPEELDIGSLEDMISRKESCPFCCFLLKVAQQHNHNVPLPTDTHGKKLHVFLSNSSIGSIEEEMEDAFKGAEQYSVQRFDIRVAIPINIPQHPAAEYRHVDIFEYLPYMAAKLDMEGESQAEGASVSELRFDKDHEPLRLHFENAIQVGSPQPSMPSRDKIPTLVGRYRPQRCDPSLFRSWIDWCDQEHKECHLPENDTLKGPIRLIDTNQQKLETFDLWDRASRRYIALSYVWGKGPHSYILTKANLQTLHGPGGLKDLPPTIADTIELVKRLGETYLWIDALCIVQDDPDDKNIQIPQMRAIYSNAYLTVIAASGDAVGAGLPGIMADRPEQPNVQIGELSVLGTAATPKQAKPFGSGQSGPLTRTNWSTRGWTYQEELLSRRCLCILEEQVIWKCKCADWLEDMNLEAINCKFKWHDLRNESGVPDLSVKNFGYLVQQYTLRDLTYETDIINAFSGIMDVIPDEFFWGIPLSTFAEYLCWSRAPGRLDFDQILTRRTTVEAPTWSWMAWKGAIRMECGDERSGTLIYCCRLRCQELECISRPDRDRYERDRTSAIIGQFPARVVQPMELINCPISLREPDLFTRVCTVDQIPRGLLSRINGNHIIFAASSALMIIKKGESWTRTYSIHPFELTNDEPPKKRLLASIGTFSAYRDPEPRNYSLNCFVVVAGRNDRLYLMMLSWKDEIAIASREYIVDVSYYAWMGLVKDRLWLEGGREMRLFVVG
jgi:hypothetical protein